jgi:hypothetical protein
MTDIFFTVSLIVGIIAAVSIAGTLLAIALGYIDVFPTVGPRLVRPVSRLILGLPLRQNLTVFARRVKTDGIPPFLG